jgi:hypothetical protein
MKRTTLHHHCTTFALPLRKSACRLALHHCTTCTTDYIGSGGGVVWQVHHTTTQTNCESEQMKMNIKLSKLHLRHMRRRLVEQLINKIGFTRRTAFKFSRFVP